MGEGRLGGGQEGIVDHSLLFKNMIILDWMWLE
jgi:hypothetical protein